MTPKQIERLKLKIRKIKAELSSDKKRHGGYFDDSRGLRYAPPQYYIQLQDYTGALRYFNWFDKNFPHDLGPSIFLFEWTLTLFKKNKIELASEKALKTFFSNTYLLDIFLNKEPLELDVSDNPEWEKSIGDHLSYSKTQPDLIDFSRWLEEFIQSQPFIEFANVLIDIRRKLKHEPAGPTRSCLSPPLFGHF